MFSRIIPKSTQKTKGVPKIVIFLKSPCSSETRSVMQETTVLSFFSQKLSKDF